MPPVKVNYDASQINNIMKSGGKAVMPLAPGMFYGPGMDAAGAATSLAFLIGELEKQDPRLLEPLTSITAPRDIDMLPGGGWVSLTSNVFVDYATSGNEEDAIIGSETNDIPVSQANLTKDVWKVFTFAEVLRLPLFDDLKLQQVGRSLTQILDEGLRLNESKLMDRNVYRGISKAGTYGLVNNPNVTSGYAAAGASGSRLWTSKTPMEIMYDVNTIINQTWANSEYDLSGMATHVLIPPTNYAHISNTPVTSSGAHSILEYLLKNNIAVNQNRKMDIFPCRWCIGAGAGTPATNRMVAYVKAPNRVNIDKTVPLSRVMTAPNVQSGSYETLYASQFSEDKILYFQCFEYADGI
jgi:hypothetical protein